MNDHLKVEDLTKYPHIFRNVYWGNFTARDDSAGHPDIISNRNKFIEQFGIVGPLAAKTDIFAAYMQKGNDTEVDHPEYYRTDKGGVVVICSNYEKEPPKELGLVPHAHLYTPTSTTYIKQWDSVAEYRAEVVGRRRAIDAAKKQKLDDEIKQIRADRKAERDSLKYPLHTRLKENHPPVPDQLGGFMPDDIHPDYILDDGTLDRLTNKDLLSKDQYGVPLVVIAAEYGHLPFIPNELLTEELLDQKYDGKSVLEFAVEEFCSYEPKDRFSYPELAWAHSPILFDAVQKKINELPIDNRTNFAQVIAAVGQLDTILGVNLPESAASVVPEEWWKRNQECIARKAVEQENQEPPVEIGI